MRHARIIVAALLLVAGHAMADPSATGRQVVSDASNLPATARDVDGVTSSRTVRARFEALVDAVTGVADLRFKLPGAAFVSTLAAHLDGWVNPRAFGVSCNGSTNDAAALAATQTAVAANGWTIQVSCKVRLATGAGTISAPLRFIGPGSLDTAPGGTVTISGTLDAPLSQVFYGTGVTLSAKVAAVYPEWWGATGNGVTDETAAMNAAGATGRLISVSPGTHILTNMLTVAAAGRLYAVDPTVSVLKFQGAGSSGASKQAVWLNGVGAGVEGVGINVAAGDYGLVVKFQFSDTFLKRSKVVHDITATATSIAQGYILYTATASPTTGIVIEGNDVTYKGIGGGSPSGLQLADGIQAANNDGLLVANNYFHDITNGTPSKLSWVMYISNTCVRSQVRDNRIENAQTSGIKQSEQSTPATDYGRRITSNVVRNVTYTGIAVEGSPGVQVQGNDVYGADLPLYINGANASVTGGHIENVVAATPPTEVAQPMITIHAAGVSLSAVTLGVKGVALTGIYTDAAKTSIDGLISNSTDPPPTAVRFVAGATGSSMSGGHLDGPVTGAGTANVDIGADDVTVTGGYVGWGAASGNAFGAKITSANVKIVGTKFLGTGVSSLYGVYIPAGATNAHVAEVSISGNTGAAISDAGTNSTLRDYLVAGKPSRKCTVTGSIATGATVTHGLGATPTSVTLTATDATPTAVYPSALGGTTFTVNYAGGGTHTFYWCGETT